MRVQSYGLSTFNNRPYETLDKAIMLLSMGYRRLPDYPCFLKVLGYYVRVKLAKVSVKNANPNAVLSIDKSNQILKGGKSV